jgi:hypothetical protein
MSSAGAARTAAVEISNARAAASRENGAQSRGPRTEEGKAKSAQNALRHGLRAQKYLVLPEEDADEFADLEAALLEELAPVGALQTVLAQRVAVAAWRLARADRIEVELFEERRFAHGGLGLALIRDGNGTRSFETLLRYRGAAMAEFWRALKTLKALQAEQAREAEQALESGLAAAAHPVKPAAQPPAAHRLRPNEPERRAEFPKPYALSEPPARGRALHEAAAAWLPNEPEPARACREAAGAVLAAAEHAASAVEPTRAAQIEARSQPANGGRSAAGPSAGRGAGRISATPDRAPRECSER